MNKVEDGDGENHDKTVQPVLVSLHLDQSPVPPLPEFDRSVHASADDHKGRKNDSTQ